MKRIKYLDDVHGNWTTVLTSEYYIEEAFQIGRTVQECMQAKSHPKFSEVYLPGRAYDYVKNFRVIDLNFPRRSGKTTWIYDNAKTNDLIIAQCNSCPIDYYPSRFWSAKHFFAGVTPHISPESASPGQYLPDRICPDNIFVDEPEACKITIDDILRHPYIHLPTIIANKGFIVMLGTRTS